MTVHSPLHSNWPVGGETGQYQSTPMVTARVRELYVEMILNAVESVANPNFLASLYPSTSKARVQDMREKDRAWILSNRRTCPLPIYTCVSFLECCEVLDLDPDSLRESFRRRGWLDGTGTFGRLAASHIVDEQKFANG